MSNPHAHPHTMRKSHAKFQNNWYKTVRGVAITRDTLCLYNQGEKWLSSQCRKSDKNWSNNYVQSTCTSSYHEENTCKVSKQWVQNCKRSCAHMIPMLNVDGWMDGRTNGRKLARLCLPAKAGATKKPSGEMAYSTTTPLPPPPPPPPTHPTQPLLRPNAAWALENSLVHLKKHIIIILSFY